MRNSGILLAGLLLAAVATGEDRSCLDTVRALGQKTEDASASWDERYAAHKEVRAALDALEKKTDPENVARYEACQAAYEPIRADVADALRRDAVPFSGWLLGLFGACLMWGGFAFCCVIAFRSGESGTEED
jgi:hypothetical protein